MDQYSSDNEATARNAVLIKKHNSIPSYALWRGIDIDSESLEIRINWWKTYTTDSGTYIKTVANYWTTILNNDQKSTTNNEPMVEIVIEDHNSCTKRGYGNELYCDI